MQPENSKLLGDLKNGDKISVILAGIIVDGKFEELVDGCVVLSEATSSSTKKAQYNLKIPLESIYAWGKKEKKKKKNDE
jgi:hypothetical protein